MAKRFTSHIFNRWSALCAGVAALLVACTSEPTAPPAKPIESTQPTPATGAPAQTSNIPAVSGARTARDYRRDAASHLYAQNQARIYGGKLPQQLFAIGVLQVDINARGAITALRWMRAPSHAPQVVAEIERTVRQAAPFPQPAHLGRVTYTDTWLWDQSGQFQLDTLTEGQL